MLEHLNHLSREAAMAHLVDTFNHNLQQGKFGLAEDVARYLMAAKHLEEQQMGHRCMYDLEINRDQSELALSYVHAWLTEHPEDEEMLNLQVHHFITQKDWDAAEEAVRHLRELFPEKLEHRETEAIIALSQGNDSLYQQYLLDALADPDYLTTSSRIAFHFAAEQREEALALIRSEFPALNRNDPAAYSEAQELVELLIENEYPIEAEHYLRSFFHDSLDEDWERDMLFYVLFDQQRYREALPYFHAPERHYPGGFVQFYNGAKLYIALNDRKNAARMIRFARETIDNEGDADLLDALIEI